MGDDFREHAAFVRERKDERLAKFDKAFSFIKTDARKIGFTLSRENGYWLFESDDDRVQWWPQSGKTGDGQHFGTWPELRAMLASMGGAE